MQKFIMARTVIEARPTSARLTVEKDVVRKALQEQLRKAQDIQQRQINTEDELTTAQNDWKKWVKYTEEILLVDFNNDFYKHELATSYGHMSMMPDMALNNLLEDINAKKTTLESIIERLEILQDPMQTSSLQSAKKIEESTQNTQDVFIVHGSNDNVKQKVAQFIGDIGLNPIILHEQPNEGRTLIEKLEHYSAVGYAVVLATPDDMGYPKEEEEKIQPRARQNVIAELGYFVGKLSRKNVSLLYSKGVELPTDFLGVVYIALDDADGWKFALAKEMKEAGMTVDLNKAL